MPHTSLRPDSIIKRNGTIVPFDREKIATAVGKAMKSAGEFEKSAAETVARAVEKRLKAKRLINKSFVPTVEGVQDEVETGLMLLGFLKSAKAYILYRAERAEKRAELDNVPEHVRALVVESKKYFENNPLGEFIYLRTYARWIESEKRRETWIETVDRYMAFMRENLGEKLSGEEYTEVREAILKQEVMPSMRLMQFAGAPARRCNTCAYNCTFIAPIALQDFAEIMYLSMQGCGVGFTVESQNIEQLPQIQKQTQKKLPTHIVVDSKEGWCDALTLGLITWYAGKDIDFDFSLVRPAGARLKTMGGKASGPEPLRSLLSFARDKIFKRQGRRLRPIDVHDIICKIGESVVSGGVRRTAMISLSDLDDREMRDAKKGQFFLTEPYRSVANNSAVYGTKPTSQELMEEWVALMKSGSGERGIFNRGSLQNTLPKRREKYFKDVGFIGDDGTVQGSIGTNPCGEIILQSKQFCNLSEIIARADDTHKSLVRKARLASLLGTYQSTLTNFKYISKDWTKHCEEERLLGVSVTGQWDSSVARNPETMRALRDMAVRTNAEYAKRFGIKPSLSVTAVKPSGTVSQTFNCSSGIHPRHAKYYIRRVRISATDSLFKILKDQGVPYYPEVGQTEENATTFVLEFPVESPGSAKFKDDFFALEQLEYWKSVKLNYTEHNPSATISVGEDEWIGVVDWIQKNWDIIGGLSFLPRFDHVYRLAPYETITREQYKEMVAQFPAIDYSKLLMYEHADETEQKRELACAGGTCEIDMILPVETALAN
ncbi:MAG: ribonucleoside-triphosphate reductase [Candidatus Zambryskibacteria bacterium CG_4_9_14_3_um_filter_42_9]|uniref:Ribonucleoside-triphosphate reductase n=1 Tax=Candidatus Zambryskibacteria bacterium CG22_combo_CG10-13_8_21_14_all_42_17 TaxID=1975118 RepID=A0A2H0BEU7_9BACT|nr:MAG: ribonucleoside-triphosphate reductase [Candidatus Zambryskibacteria bacterium CG22_combo_CG10-13_8_21_14_all_42_17]PJA36841.1 MAG: ribonucleoside-triphosphate reductase [Candidatus Zambryskibacteria bacterium CG_4_9_14_3_um_filter_42_9]